MRQFKSYPIYIVYSERNQYVAAAYGDGLYGADMTKAEIVTDEISRPSKFDNYEYFVESWLKLIESKTIGLKLLQMLNPKIKIWIVPRYNGAIRTFPFPPGREDLGIRIHFSQFDLPPDEWNNTLFHELVHAMRIGNYRYYQLPMDPKTYSSTEEFLAHIMENTFRSCLRKKVYRSYHNSNLLSKGDAYHCLVDNPEAIMGLKWFLGREQFAKQVGKMKFIDYNPFRDYQVLARMSRDKFGNIKEYADLY